MAINTKLSNVIGAPFSEYVLRQLAIRAYRSSTGAVSQFGIRTNEEVLYLANKTSWVRFVSSVNLDFPPNTNWSAKDSATIYALNLGIQGSGPYIEADSFAKNWILQSGTSKQNGDGITLRRGIGPDGAYGLGGTEELGYRPMPGLTSVTIETAGRLGSLRTATINFHVWNMNQLNTIEALYFRLGYSMLLEWGHTQYFKNYGKDLQTETEEGVFTPQDVYGIGDPFVAGLRKEAIQEAIAKKRYETSGNYDGMFGMVVNFNWSYNQDGGYDCSVKLVGLGAIIDSVKINQAYTLPKGTLKRFQIAADYINQLINNEIARKVKAATASLNTGAGASGEVTQLPELPKNAGELRRIMIDYDSLTESGNLQTVYGVQTIRNYAAATGNNYDYVAQFTTPTAGKDPNRVTAVADKITGIYLNARPGGFIYLAPPSKTANKTPVVFDKDVVNAFALRSNTVDYGSPVTRGTLYAERPVSELASFGPGFTYLFDVATQYSVLKGVDSGYIEPTFIVTDLQPRISNALDATVLERTFTAEAAFPVGSTTATKKVSLTLTPEYPSSFTPFFGVTRQNLLSAVEKWDGQAFIESYTFTKSSSQVTLNGFFYLEVFAPYTGPENKNFANLSVIAPKGQPDRTLVDVNGEGQLKYIIRVKFSANDTGFFSAASLPPPSNVSAPAAGTVNPGPDPALQQVATDNQIDASMGFESALHAMLTVVQTESQYQASKLTKGVTTAYGTSKDPSKVVIVDIQGITKEFYVGGALDGIFDIKDPNVSPKSFDLKKYAAKGFSSELMTDPEKFEQINYIGGNTFAPDFKTFCQSLVIKYLQKNPLTDLQFPGQFQVYIPLGYLLAFINNMCLFYDSKEKIENANTPSATGNEKRPYVYIDFNPETNFCLTSPQQLSVDPNVCIVPANLDQTQYLEIFPVEYQPDSPFNPTKGSTVTQALDTAKLNFKSSDTAYRGKTMNIMVCTQYLLRILREFATGNREHAVAFQPFLDRIMADINKALGNTNLFRVAYRDDTNTVQIQDDQYVPYLNGENTALNRDLLLSNILQNATLAGELPLFASQVRGANGNTLAVPSLGIAREMQFKTVMSSRMASKLAISAQAETGSVNTTDHSELSWLNKNYRDRYKPYILDASRAEGTTPTPGTTVKNNNSPKSNNKEAANKFNEHVKTVYSTLALSEDAIEPSKNYYIERMSKVKSKDVVTSAAPFIPAEIEITMDGIAGIIMGNAFVIPPQRLPNTYLSEDGSPRVGFIVNGLTHRIENNEWTTTLKGQMIKLREQSGLGTTVVTATGKQEGLLDFTSGTTGGAPPTGTSRTPRNTDLFKNNGAPATSEYLLGKAKTIPNTPAHANWGGLREIWQNANAWDLMVAAGTPVYAIVDGTVSGIYFSENRNTVWGYAFTLKGTNSSFFYTHLDSVLVSSGTSVTKGQLLGYIGQWPDDYTRLRNNPHLHIGVEFGKLLDYVDANGKLK